MAFVEQCLSRSGPQHHISTSGQAPRMGFQEMGKYFGQWEILRTRV
jgi:hypothetical protein